MEAKKVERQWQIAREQWALLGDKPNEWKSIRPRHEFIDIEYGARLSNGDAERPIGRITIDSDGNVSRHNCL